MTPTKPTRVDVKAMQAVLKDLTVLQSNLSAGDAFTTLQGMSPLTEDLRGMQQNVGTVTGQRYADSLKWMAQSHQSLVTGVTTLVSLLTNTIDQHSKADHDAVQGANATGTATGGSSSGNSTATSPSALGGN